MDWSKPPGVTRLILVRHGETEASGRGRCIGRTDIALSEAGRRQAVALASWLRRSGVSAVYASTSRRAIDTAAPTAAACVLHVRPMQELCEVSFGALEGLSFEDVEARFPATWLDWMARPATVRFPGGESLPCVQERALRAQATMVQRHPGQTVVAFSHGGPIRALVGGALGLLGHEVFGLDVLHGSAVALEWAPGPGRSGAQGLVDRVVQLSRRRGEEGFAMRTQQAAPVGACLLHAVDDEPG